MGRQRRTRLGELLLARGVLDEASLERALAANRGGRRRLGAALVEAGVISEAVLLDVLAEQLGLPYIDLTRHEFDPAVVDLIPEIQARRFRAIALQADDDHVLVGMSDPTDLYACDELGRLLGRTLRTAVVRERDLLACLDSHYRREGEIAGFAEQLEVELAQTATRFEAPADAAPQDAPVVRLLDSLLEDAVQRRASDLHIEPDDAVLRIRMRVDGVLHEQTLDEARIAPALVQRLKLMGRMNIAEKRLPQDGRFSTIVHGRRLDVRVATMPIEHGEAVTMRLLDQSEGVLSIDALGMSAETRDRFRSMMHLPHGMVVVTGPTGSGKTTTLYAGLRERNAAGEKIITVEDPVEYRLPRINQVQVRADIGLGFGAVLRASLRHDPDVILIGEIRDEETANIALRAAITGHMVLSTLHTNDAVGAVARMFDLGQPGYLLASSMRAIVAQRLVRRLCPSCSREVPLTPAQRVWAESRFSLPRGGFRRGAGCPRCGHSGYRGRVGIYEMLEIDDALGTAIAQEDTVGCAAAAAAQAGYLDLQQAAFNRACAHRTSLEEAMRLYVDVTDADAVGF